MKKREGRDEMCDREREIKESAIDKKGREMREREIEERKKEIKTE